MLHKKEKSGTINTTLANPTAHSICCDAFCNSPFTLCKMQQWYIAYIIHFTNLFKQL